MSPPANFPTRSAKYSLILSQVRKTWAKEIWRKGWGWRVRVRVTLRKRLRREPNEAELRNAYKDVDNAYKEITIDDVQSAYDRGEEVSSA